MSDSNSRAADYPVDDVFLERWSPRAFSDQDVSEADLMSILEAARWAPSAFNAQPWRIVYARKGDAHWDKLTGLLVDMNKAWAAHAPVIMALFSDTVFVSPTGATKEATTNSFDAGAAWMSMAIQATRLKLHMHAMAGFDHEAINGALGVPATYKPEAMMVLGYQGDAESLPDPLKAREAPSSRKPVSEIAFSGQFKK